MLKSIFVGPQGIRAGWRFLLFVLGGFALGRGLDWLITHPLGYHYSPGWNPYDFMIDGASILAVAVFVAWVEQDRASQV
jgi:hypothetical protein